MRNKRRLSARAAGRAATIRRLWERLDLLEWDNAVLGRGVGAAKTAEAAAAGRVARLEQQVGGLEAQLTDVIEQRDRAWHAIEEASDGFRPAIADIKSDTVEPPEAGGQGG
jgi:hypothetical protein